MSRFYWNDTVAVNILWLDTAENHPGCENFGEYLELAICLLVTPWEYTGIIECGGLINRGPT